MGRKALLVLVFAFALLMLAGIFTPCMGMRMNSHFLIEPVGPVPKFAGPAIDDVLKARVNADVSLAGCAARLLHWVFTRQEANCVFAFMMLTVFALLLPVADMVALLAVGLEFTSEMGGYTSVKGPVRENRTMSLSH